MREESKMENAVRIDMFLDEEGRLTQIPAKEKKRRAALEHLAGKFQPDTDYTELEVNGVCSSFSTFGDYFLLRRLLVEEGLLARERDGSRYWRTKSETDTGEQK